MSHIPFPSPSNQNNARQAAAAAARSDRPWVQVKPSDDPPPFLQIRHHDGRIVQFAYCDVREIRMRDAGQLTLCIYGFDRYEIEITGRNLTELLPLLSDYKVKSLVEMGPRTFHLPEDAVAIDKIAINVVLPPQ